MEGDWRQWILGRQKLLTAPWWGGHQQSPGLTGGDSACLLLCPHAAVDAHAAGGWALQGTHGLWVSETAGECRPQVRVGFEACAVR